VKEKCGLVFERTFTRSPGGGFCFCLLEFGKVSSESERRSESPALSNDVPSRRFLEEYVDDVTGF
jgi:hypothetical protein